MSLLACFLYVVGEIQPALGATQWVILQGQSKKNYHMKKECRHQTQPQCGPRHPAPSWVPRHQLPPKDHKHYNPGNQGWSDPVGFSFVVEAKDEVHDFDRQELAQEVVNPRLIAFEPPESNRGDQHASHDRRRDHGKNSAQIFEKLPGMNTKRVLDTTAFVQCLNMEPARLRIPPKHRKRSHSKCKQHRQTLPAEKEMSVWPRPAEEQRNPNQLDCVDELCEKTDADGYPEEHPIAHFPGFESRPR